MIIYFAPMEGITDGVFRRVHRKMFGGADVYGLPFHKLTQAMTLMTREKRDVDPEENRGIDVLPHHARAKGVSEDPEGTEAKRKPWRLRRKRVSHGGNSEAK